MRGSRIIWIEALSSTGSSAFSWPATPPSAAPRSPCARQTTEHNRKRGVRSSPTFCSMKSTPAQAVRLKCCYRIDNGIIARNMRTALVQARNSPSAMSDVTNNSRSVHANQLLNTKIRIRNVIIAGAAQATDLTPGPSRQVRGAAVEGARSQVIEAVLTSCAIRPVTVRLGTLWPDSRRARC